MKILFIVRALGNSGASKQLAMTANALVKRGHEVAAFTYCSNQSYEQLSDKVKYISSKVYGKLSEYIYTVFNIRKVVKRERPDIVISWRANAGCFTRLATIGLCCKVVYSERTDPYMETSAFLKFATWVCGFSDGGVFQTEKARDYYRRLAPKSVVIPNPFECKSLPEIVPISERMNEIACVGRFFIVQKRQDVLLEAFKKVHQRFPHYKLVFYGDGADLYKVKLIAEGLRDAVVFKGAVKDVIEYVKNSRLLVLSSDYEGIPNVILEAFAAGTPVVSTDCSPGGAKVLIEDEINGFIVPCRNVDAIAEKSIQVITDDNLSLQFIEASRKKLAEFNYERIADRWNEYIINIKA